MLPLSSLKKTYAYHVVRRYILGLLYRVPLTKKYAYRRLPRHRSGYKHYYVHDKNYVATLQVKTERVKSIEYYPSTEALRSRIDKNGGRKVLDAGCGYGRLLERMAPYYDAEGCDVSEELLNQTRSKGLKAFQLDLVDPPKGWPEQHSGSWDVAYCRAVFMFFIDHREDTFRAMQTLDTVTKNRVLIWDWPHVCDYMRETYPSDKFEYHEIPFTST
jgi:SAM-dependent methyltransferase